MKSTETKTTASNPHLQAKANSPFFGKQEGNTFFSDTQSESKPFFSPPTIQTKLSIGQPGDKYEQEADSMADKVVQRMSNPHPIQRQCNDCEQEDKLQKKEDEELSLKKEEIQRKPIFESNGDPPEDNIQRKCATCTTPNLMTKSNGNASTASAGLQSQLNASKGGGQALPKDTQTSMGSAFGADFSNVNIHTGSDAVQMNQELGAQAFTHGRDVYFNEGKYDTGSSGGQHLLAHELTHVVQQGGGLNQSINKKEVIQRNNEKKDIRTATPAEIANTPKPTGNYSGFIKKNGTQVEIYLKNFKAKRYLTNEDTSWIRRPIKLPKKTTKDGKRKTKQAKIWNNQVKDGIGKQLVKMTNGDIEDSKPLTFKLSKGNSKGFIGSLKNIRDEILTPFWTFDGKPSMFDIEHMVDWQIAGAAADDKRNLILLERKYNRGLGGKVKKGIENHLSGVTNHYRNYFKNLGKYAKTNLKWYDVFIKSLTFEKEGLEDSQWYFADEVKSSEFPGNPFKTENIEISDAKIPKNHFLLITSLSRPGYILPYNVKKKLIGAFEVTTKYDRKTKKLIKIELVPILKDRKKAIAKSKKIKPIDTPFDITDVDTYTISSDLIAKFSGKLKELIGGVKGASPIQFNEPQLDGLDVLLTGKVDSTLSIFRNLNIGFIYRNGEFSVYGVIDGTQLAKNFPKPFTVTNCSIIIEASSTQGLSVIGYAAFKLSKFGEGEITAIGGNKVVFGGSFKFLGDSIDSMIDFNYDGSKDKGEGSQSKSPWKITGIIKLKEGLIKGVKNASLKISYEDKKLKGKGNVGLAIPKGIKGTEISFEYGINTGAFKFVVNLSLKDIPGIEDGKIEGIISSGDDESGNYRFGINADLKLNFKLPGLSQLGVKPESLKVSYDSLTEIFNVTGVIKIKKSKFEGEVTVGVSNRKVDAEGKPIEGEKNEGFLIYGFGQLTISLTKEYKPTIGAKLTPEGDVILNAGLKLKNRKLGKRHSINRDLFNISTPDIPIFNIGVASVYLKAGGSIGVYAGYNPLTINGDLELKGLNLSKLDDAEIRLKGDVTTMAEAGLKFGAYLEVGATALIIYASGRATVKMDVGAEAEAQVKGDMSWSPISGFTVNEAGINLSLAIVVKTALELKVSAGIYYWIGKKSVWSDTFPLYSKTFPPLAEMKTFLPLTVNDGEIKKPTASDLKIKENPLDSKERAGKYLQGAVTGEKLKPQEKKLSEYKKELLGVLYALPEKMPFTTEAKDRYSFIDKIRAQVGEEEAFFLENELYQIEYREFEELRIELLNANQSFDLNSVLTEFQIIHPQISHESIDLLIEEIREKEDQEILDASTSYEEDNQSFPIEESQSEQNMSMASQIQSKPADGTIHEKKTDS